MSRFGQVPIPQLPMPSGGGGEAGLIGGIFSGLLGAAQGLASKSRRRGGGVFTEAVQAAPEGTYAASRLPAASPPPVSTPKPQPKPPKRPSRACGPGG